MKKTAFALAALGLVASSAQAQSSVTVYGVIDVGLTYTTNATRGTTPGSNGSRFSIDSGDLATSRIGFRGVEDLGGGLKALFQLENGFNADTGGMASANTLFDRKSVVGLSGSFGTVTLGRQVDFLDDIGSKYTSVQTFGGNGVKGAHFGNLDRVAGSRADNSVRFDSANYGGFTGNLFYSFGEVAGNTSAGQGFGFGANYVSGPFGIGGAYYQTKLSAASGTAQPGDTNLKTFTLGTSYQFGPAKLYGAWSQTKRPLQGGIAPGLVSSITTQATKGNVIDIGVDYALKDNLHLLGSVIHDRIDIARTSTGATRARTTQFNLGVDYYLSKRTDVYAMWSNLRASDARNPGVINNAYDVAAPFDASTQNVVRVGLRHKF
ncbi:porin [Herbaspirillum chlorophenolicum]|jgi:predicted porin|uniref:Porin n=1 Tax=Herbaspirillum chlorophenolicum TaxID=211589 RepID=A0ABW8EZ14_9BURK|nr:porin [Herbaspirillum chlorophenolicum]